MILPSGHCTHTGTLMSELAELPSVGSKAEEKEKQIYEISLSVFWGHKDRQQLQAQTNNNNTLAAAVTTTAENFGKTLALPTYS